MDQFVRELASGDRLEPLGGRRGRAGEAGRQRDLAEQVMGVRSLLRRDGRKVGR